MTTAEPSSLTLNSSVFPSPDKYRGAVVEVCYTFPPNKPFCISLNLFLQFLFFLKDLQLPPAFSLPRTELIAHAIELAYDRDFSHIPYV
jgi:hypothetical protein